MLASRDTIMTESGRYHAVVAWRVNDVQKIAWLICAGVDGIITDQVWVKQESKPLQRQH